MTSLILLLMVCVYCGMHKNDTCPKERVIRIAVPVNLDSESHELVASNNPYLVDKTQWGSYNEFNSVVSRKTVNLDVNGLRVDRSSSDASSSNYMSYDEEGRTSRSNSEEEQIIIRNPRVKRGFMHKLLCALKIRK